MDYLQEFLPDLAEFRDKTMQFHRGELKVPEYKGFSGGFGSYAQRGGKKHMLRLRMAGGRLTKERLKFIADAVEKYGIDRIKLTTCQSVQLHDLEAEDLCELMEAAWNAGMISRGGGGDFPRNVMASPLSGVETGEYFDVMPYAEAMGEYLMQFIRAVKFPRKLKVCFSNSPKNETHATFRDLGFVARQDKTFDVYAAGGLGNRPALGAKVAEHVPGEKILYYAKAMVDTFVTYGNYENRGRARTRFMQETLGTEGFVKAYQEKLAKVLAEEKLDITVEPVAVEKTATKDVLRDRRIVPQKQAGLYAVFYQPIGGFLPPEKAKALCGVIADMEQVELRLTPEEGLYIINCTAEEAKKLLALTEDGARSLFETSVACVGSTICQVGVGDSSGMLKTLVEEIRKENFADGVLPQIHISGCPSSCSAHQIGEIGFRGAVKQSPQGPKPAFAVSVGGCPLQGQEVIAEAGAAIAAEDLPGFLIELGHKIEQEKTVYAEWIKRNRKQMQELVEKYTR
ncbi:MAG: nitrite/sulfite reductase [Muribaculaceae bacterium]|nr:nitrite/sulfite reductase [Roseburia sp.]MCM1430686.1 nitrite/sulfite reductase [Muribaculaceae bacterium]MCM1491953.1 nitrite/sulfite reductase [Muribaculaceae bacterium]